MTDLFSSEFVSVATGGESVCSRGQQHAVCTSDLCLVRQPSSPCWPCGESVSQSVCFSVCLSVHVFEGSNTQCVLQIFALLDNHRLPAGHVVSQSV